MLFDDVAAFANATECIVTRTGGNDEMILYLASSQSGGAQDWLVEMFFTDSAGVNRLANLDYSKRNHVTWEFRLWGRNQGQYDPNECYISFDAVYNDAYAIYPSNVKVNPSGYTQIYYDFDLPSYCTDLDFMALYMPFNTALTDLNIELYEFTLVSYGEADEIIENDNKNHESLMSGLANWFSGLLSGILDGLKNLFVPSDEYMSGFFSEFNDFLEEHLGFLYYPIACFINIFESILAIDPNASPSITLPALVVPVGEESYTIWEEQAYAFDFLQDEPYKTIHGYYLMAVDAVIAFSLVNLFKRKMDEMMTG